MIVAPPVVTVRPVATVTVPVKLAVAEIVCELIAPEVVIVVTPARAPEIVSAPFVVRRPAECVTV